MDSFLVKPSLYIWREMVNGDGQFPRETLALYMEGNGQWGWTVSS